MCVFWRAGCQCFRRELRAAPRLCMRTLGTYRHTPTQACASLAPGHFPQFLRCSRTMHVACTFRSAAVFPRGMRQAVHQTQVYRHFEPSERFLLRTLLVPNSCSHRSPSTLCAYAAILAPLRSEHTQPHPSCRSTPTSLRRCRATAAACPSTTGQV